jgi:hypothetical protein
MLLLYRGVSLRDLKSEVMAQTIWSSPLLDVVFLCQSCLSRLRCYQLRLFRKLSWNFYP